MKNRYLTLNEFKTNAEGLEDAFEKLKKLRADVAEQFIINHELPTTNPFKKLKVVTLAALYSEIIELIEFYSDPKNKNSKMRPFQKTNESAKIYD